MAGGIGWMGCGREGRGCGWVVGRCCGGCVCGVEGTFEEYCLVVGAVVTRDQQVAVVVDVKVEGAVLSL